MGPVCADSCASQPLGWDMKGYTEGYRSACLQGRRDVLSSTSGGEEYKADFATVDLRVDAREVQAEPVIQGLHRNFACGPVDPAAGLTKTYSRLVKSALQVQSPLLGGRLGFSPNASYKD